MLGNSHLVGILCVLICVLLYTLVPIGNNCVVIITGESVRISSCLFDEHFVEFAKTVKPAGSC
ncbi:triple gene block protein 3 [Pseudostellaria heterophylla carlavirus 1]|uniref:Movement protein TGBp3 n=1 Tax=Pseudostellaria heterophylla carlavirus 1 TaxID=2982810 RepID=A0A977TNK3_9VIRU|nr:triple gene block protein 3 [Pseudostellaria heterophylla carlavirus 1]